jgi:2-polyprenyl-3-methyl-5-hydroxy-6-metoxy-1,4-benzoquinol methylase
LRSYPEIVDHYGQADEQSRLTHAEGRLELLRSRETLGRVLPRAPAVVYDVGGGAGAYATWLARAGYVVHLIDLVPKHVEQARAAASRDGVTMRSFTVGDARALNVAEGGADAVLLMGPLYHLPAAEDRIQCWREARRILRPDGVVVGAIISRFASMLDGLRRDLVSDPAFEAILMDDLATGVHRNSTANADYFTTAYLQRHSEAVLECEAAGLRVQEIVGLEGPAWLFPDLERRLDDPQTCEQLLGFLRLVESEPSLLGVSAHSLVIARKPS